MHLRFGGLIFGRAFFFFFLEGGGGGLLSEFYGINANNNVNFTCHVNSLFSLSQFLFGGGGHSTKFFYGEALPQGPNRYLFMYHF